MAHRLNWNVGHRGKGYILRNGEIHTWPVDAVTGEPHHLNYFAIHNLTSQPAVGFTIDPSGGVADNDGHGTLDSHALASLAQVDPDLHKAQPEEDWSLERGNPPQEEEPHGPDLNFILSHDESDGWTPESNDDYAVMLKQWLDDLPGFAPPAALSPHHQDVHDIIPQATLSPSDATSLYPPGHEPDWAKQGADGRTPWLSKLLRKRR